MEPNKPRDRSFWGTPVLGSMLISLPELMNFSHFFSWVWTILVANIKFGYFFLGHPLSKCAISNVDEKNCPGPAVPIAEAVALAEALAEAIPVAETRSVALARG